MTQRLSVRSYCIPASILQFGDQLVAPTRCRTETLRLIRKPEWFTLRCLHCTQPSADGSTAGMGLESTNEAASSSQSSSPNSLPLSSPPPSPPLFFFFLLFTPHFISCSVCSSRPTDEQAKDMVAATESFQSTHLSIKAPSL